MLTSGNYLGFLAVPTELWGKYICENPDEKKIKLFRLDMMKSKRYFAKILHNNLEFD